MFVCFIDQNYIKLSKKFIKGDTPKLQASLDDFAKQISTYLGSKPYSIGDHLTYVDFTVFEVLDLINFVSEGRILAENPNLKSFMQRMEQLPRFDRYWKNEAMKRPYKLHGTGIEKLREGL